MSDSILVTRTGPVTEIKLNRPKVHNAFDDQLVADLTAALGDAELDANVRCVILTGAGNSFSAGADLNWMRGMAGASEAENHDDALRLAALMRTLNFLAKPTIARVNGAAYGGGVGLVACCDIAIASERASFCLSEVKLGILPAAISPYVVAAIGPRQARRYFQTAEVIPADEARRIGLVHEVVPPDQLDAARDRILAAIFQGAPGAQADSKDLVFTVDRPLTDEIMSETGRRIALRRASVEGREGIGAFLAKREPAWRREN